MFTDRKMAPDGKILYKDHVSGAKGREVCMTCESGNYYEGDFVDDEFQGDKGVYLWEDGDNYTGSWKNGERHGKGRFKMADGSVECLEYNNAEAKGEGINLSADGKTAYTLLDGEGNLEILVEDTKSMIKEKLGFSTL